MDPPPSTLYVTTTPHERPSTCAPFRLAADAAIDGTEPPFLTVTRDPHLAQCPACHAWLATYHAYRRRLRAAGEALRAPDGLRARIAAVLHAPRGASGS